MGEVRINKVKPPCKGCDNRHLGCHGECEEYKTFTDENEKQRKLKTSNINFTYMAYFKDKKTQKLREKKRCGR